MEMTLLILLLTSFSIVKTHDDYGNEESAHYKYSQQANDKIHAHEYHDNQQSSSHSHSHYDKPSKMPKSIKYDENGILAFMNDPVYSLWVCTIGSTLLISAAPFFILFLIPVQSNTAQHEPMLKVLLSFASGGLLGDAFLHLIPHALMAQNTNKGHSHSHSHSEHHEPHDLSIGLFVLLGLATFLIVEKLVRIARRNYDDDVDDGHCHGKSKKNTKNIRAPKSKEEISVRKRKHSDNDENEDELLVENVMVPKRDMKVAGYLNLAADFAHNFTDGLAVGASYLAGNTIGVVTTLTVLLHEVPHEIGDFAILVQSGCTKRKAMFLQLLTAIGALLGCIVSLLASDPSGLADSTSASWVLPFTAGGFIYIATVSVIPELLEDSGLWQSIKEISALFFGISMMALITWLE